MTKDAKKQGSPGFTGLPCRVGASGLPIVFPFSSSSYRRNILPKA